MCLAVFFFFLINFFELFFFIGIFLILLREVSELRELANMDLSVLPTHLFLSWV
jgi:hypothetical protein